MNTSCFIDKTPASDMCHGYYIPLRLCGYGTKGKLDIIVLASRLIQSFSLTYILLELLNVSKVHILIIIIHKICENWKKNRYLVNHGFVLHNVSLIYNHYIESPKQRPKGIGNFKNIPDHILLFLIHS